MNKKNLRRDVLGAIVFIINRNVLVFCILIYRFVLDIYMVKIKNEGSSKFNLYSVRDIDISYPRRNFPKRGIVRQCC